MNDILSNLLLEDPFISPLVTLDTLTYVSLFCRLTVHTAHSVRQCLNLTLTQLSQ